MGEMTDWKPVNPCDTCTNVGELQDKNYCKNHCSLIIPYTAAINYQRKLLEYLIASYTKNSFVFAVEVMELESMLKELESEK